MTIVTARNVAVGEQFILFDGRVGVRVLDPVTKNNIVIEPNGAKLIVSLVVGNPAFYYINADDEVHV